MRGPAGSRWWQAAELPEKPIATTDEYGGRYRSTCLLAWLRRADGEPKVDGVLELDQVRGS